MIVNLSSRVISDIKKDRNFWDKRGRVEIYMSDDMFCVFFGRLLVD